MKKFPAILLCALCFIGGRYGIVHADICAATPCADVNNDGVATATDALAALLLAVGLSVPEPFCDFTVCRGHNCNTRTLPISSLSSEPTGDEACYNGQVK